jgi:hypothetical protein
MYENDWKLRAWDTQICDNLSWRGLLSQKIGFNNLNFSCGASSNQKQFRLATEFFASSQYGVVKKRFDRIIVIWGITSTARNELWSLDHNDFHNFFLSEYNDEFSRFIVEHCYDHDAEVFQLRNLMLFWNLFFKNQNIKNFWVDTFNTHNYDFNFLGNRKSKTYRVDAHQAIQKDLTKKRKHYDEVSGSDWPSFEDWCLGKVAHVSSHIKQEIYEIFGDPTLIYAKLPTTLFFDDSHRTLEPIVNLLDHDKYPRDLASYLMIKSGIVLPQDQQEYHFSNWISDRKYLQELTDIGLLNPYSYHPTKQGHVLLCDYLVSQLQKEFEQ